jgi:YggT family protein
MSSVFVFSLIPYPLNVVLYYLVQGYVLVIVFWAVLSWFNKGKGLVNDVYNALDKLVDPFIELFRRFIPTAGGMDFSPLVAILILQILVRFLL